MSSLPVVEHLDVVEDPSACHVIGEELLVMGQLVFQGAEEAFDDCVVVGHGLATHTRLDAGRRQLGAIGTARVLAALVAVVNQARGGPAVLHGRLRDIAGMIDLSKATMGNIWQNIAVSLGLKAVFLVTTIIGVTGLWPAILADTGATVLVTLNAMRLLAWKPR